MSSMSPPSYNLPLFDGKMDFSIWKLKLKCILILERVHKAIDLSYSATVTEEEKSEMNERALSTIMLNLSDSVLRHVSTIESAKELWDKLDKMYTKTSLPSRMSLLENFINFKLDLSKGIDENLEFFNNLIEDLKLSGDEHIDDYTAFVLLNSIPDSYSDVKSAIKSAVEHGRGDLSMDIVVNALKGKELVLKQGGSSEVRGKAPNNSSSAESGVEHLMGKKKSGQSEHAHMSSCNCTVSFGELFMTYVDNPPPDPVRETDWIWYSGCASHMTPLKHVLSNYRHVDNGFVSLINGSKCHVAGLGDVVLKFRSGFVCTLKNVIHVPAICDNFLCVGALAKAGLWSRMENESVEIFKGSSVKIKAERRRGVYICVADPLSAPR